MNVVPLSGGWDSALCLVRAIRAAGRENVLAVFVDYGQSYRAQERIAALSIASALRVKIVCRRVPPIESQNGVFKARNKTILEIAAREGASRIWFGCRNPFASLDRFGDSNRRFAAGISRELGVPISTPCLWLPKAVIRWAVQRGGVPVSLVYSTEEA